MTNPYDYHLPVITPNMFFGRRELLTEIINSVCSSQPRSYIILGGRRCGKTSLLRAVERELLNRNDTTGQLATVPVYVDLNRETITTRQAFFETVLGKLHKFLAMHLHALQIEHLSRLDPIDLVGGFESAILGIIRGCAPFTPRIVLLLDETEHIFSMPWCHDLLANQRALVSNSALRDYFEIIMVGSSRLYQESSRVGSPLYNIMVCRSLANLPRQETERLIHEPTGNLLPETIVDAIWQEAAGHPFLSQFIMYHLWNAGLQHVSAESVLHIAQSFSEEESRSDFSDWCEDLGQIGQTVYLQLASVSDGVWVTYSRLLALKIAEPLHLLRLLDALCFHGIAERAMPKHPKRFRATGLMFRRWFVDTVLGEEEGQTDKGVAITPTLTPSQRKHLKTQQAELDKRYDTLTKKIAALDADIGRENDEFRKQPLKEHRASLIAERAAIVEQLAEIEHQLADVDPIPGT